MASQGCGVAGALSVEGAAGGGREALLVGARAGRVRGCGHSLVSLVLRPPGFVCPQAVRAGEGWGTSPLGVSPLLAQTFLSSIVLKTTPVPVPLPRSQGLCLCVFAVRSHLTFPAGPWLLGGGLNQRGASGPLLPHPGVDLGRAYLSAREGRKEGGKRKKEGWREALPGPGAASVVPQWMSSPDRSHGGGWQSGVGWAPLSGSFGGGEGAAEFFLLASLF